MFEKSVSQKETNKKATYEPTKKLNLSFASNIGNTRYLNLQLQGYDELLA